MENHLLKDLRSRVIGADKSGWVAIDKPSGLSVHNEPGRDAISLVLNALNGDSILGSTCDWEKGFMPTAVHRLDRDTSGVLILATRRDAARSLHQAFESKIVQKTYRAVVRGQVPEKGLWEFALTDKAEGRRQPAGAIALRKEAVTAFTRLRTNRHLSEIEIDLKTGRQHQIRRHAVIAGHAIVGDRRYGDPRVNTRIKNLFGVERLLLHSWRLLLPSLQISVEAPVPGEFDRVFVLANK